MQSKLIFFVLLYIVILHTALIFELCFDFAKILTVPALFAFTFPFGVTVATFLFELLHVTVLDALDGIVFFTFKVLDSPFTIISLLLFNTIFFGSFRLFAASVFAGNNVKTIVIANNAVINFLNVFFNFIMYPFLFCQRL